jgi:hypothetical protein
MPRRGKVEDKVKARRHGVFLRLNDAENGELKFLQERECLPKAQVLRRLLIREARAAHRTHDEVCA